MTTEMLQSLLEVTQFFVTIVVFLLIFAVVVKLFLAVTFSMDLIIIIATFFGLRVLSRQQTVWRMGREAGMGPFYTKRQCDEIFRIFLSGYRAEQAAANPSHPS